MDKLDQVLKAGARRRAALQKCADEFRKAVDALIWPNLERAATKANASGLFHSVELRNGGDKISLCVFCEPPEEDDAAPDHRLDCEACLDQRHGGQVLISGSDHVTSQRLAPGAIDPDGIYLTEARFLAGILEVAFPDEPLDYGTMR
ncbi:MAG: hypothetical protein GY953_20875 [bacterium]|nr:hypothetical protein [bacterium]